jgi:hypothetical protein
MCHCFHRWVEKSKGKKHSGGLRLRSPRVPKGEAPGAPGVADNFDVLWTIEICAMNAWATQSTREPLNNCDL